MILKTEKHLDLERINQVRWTSCYMGECDRWFLPYGEDAAKVEIRYALDHYRLAIINETIDDDIFNREMQLTGTVRWRRCANARDASHLFPGPNVMEALRNDKEIRGVPVPVRYSSADYRHVELDGDAPLLVCDTIGFRPKSEAISGIRVLWEGTASEMPLARYVAEILPLTHEREKILTNIKK